MYILLSELLLRTFLSSLVSIGVTTLQLPPLRSPTPQRTLLLSSPCADILARGSLQPSKSSHAPTCCPNTLHWSSRAPRAVNCSKLTSPVMLVMPHQP